MDKTIQLDILGPDKTIFQGLVSRVQVPGELGSFEMLHNHAPLISSLTKGKIRVVDKDDNVFFFEVNSGMVKVFQNHISILINS